MANHNDDHKYDDIIHLPHPVSHHRSRMSSSDRAAQFSPFAALTGFDDCIEESARLTDRMIQLDEGRMEELNEKLLQIQEAIDTQPQVTLTHFRYDARKAGGAYVRTTGNVKKIDEYSQSVLFTDGRAVWIPMIIQIE